MAGLQRFIAYINKYENDEKMDNSGFAKIEIRGSLCRVEVHIRNTSVNQTEATVYLFTRKEEIIQGIPVGSMEISRGGGDVRYSFDTREMLEFGVSMDKMQGIFIPLGESSFLASQWKEGVMAGKNFQILEKQEAPQMQAEEEISQEETASVPELKDGNMPRQQSTAEIAEQKIKSAAPVPKGQPKKEVTVENGFVIQKDVPSGQAGVAERRERKTPDAAPKNMPQTNFQPQEQPRTQESAQENAQEDINIRATELPLEDFLEETGWERVFKKLRLKSEICFPFEGQEIECIRMNLNDLREFPQKYWYLSKNSFLLHGFFNYRHILLGEVKENGKKEYFLGIPGVFQNQERLMASMFGFPGFRMARAAEYKTGSFGYWYRVI